MSLTVTDGPPLAPGEPVLYSMTRLTVHLPVTHSDIKKSKLTQKASQRIIDKFKNRHGGSTYVSPYHSNFKGSWMNMQVNPPFPMEGSVTLLMIDAPFDFYDDQASLQAIEEIRKFSFDAYGKAGVGQYEVWITASPVMIRLLDVP